MTFWQAVKSMLVVIAGGTAVIAAAYWLLGLAGVK